MMRVLGIETSCDETAVAIYDSKAGLLSHCLYSQLKLHDQFGGVVPELASRDHNRKILPLLKEALQQAQLRPEDIDGVAYTVGPGLVGALLVAAMVGRTLAWQWQKPAVGVHHMEAHLLAPMLEPHAPQFPFLALLVSGGHTMLVHVNGLGDYQVLGESLDDAAGEAFDKTAKLLGLPYPGGPALAALAEQGQLGRYQLPRPMTDRPGLDFSFSGLKTSALHLMQQIDPGDNQARADLACAFQDAIVSTLAIKCERALMQTGLKQLVIAGGVSANRCLRQRLQEMTAAMGVEVFYPRFEFCTDNAAMVAYTGCQRLLRGQCDDLAVRVVPRWSLEEISL